MLTITLHLDGMDSSLVYQLPNYLAATLAAALPTVTHNLISKEGEQLDVRSAVRRYGIDLPPDTTLANLAENLDLRPAASTCQIRAEDLPQRATDLWGARCEITSTDTSPLFLMRIPGSMAAAEHGVNWPLSSPHGRLRGEIDGQKLAACAIRDALYREQTDRFEANLFAELLRLCNGSHPRLRWQDNQLQFQYISQHGDLRDWCTLEEAAAFHFS